MSTWQCALASLWLCTCVVGCKGSNSPSGEQGSGIPECDQYIALVRTCAKKQPKDEDRARMESGADKLQSDLQRGEFGSAAEGDEDKEGMRQICATSLRGENPVIGWCDPKAAAP